jgi:hypothetical protein
VGKTPIKKSFNSSVNIFFKFSSKNLKKKFSKVLTVKAFCKNCPLGFRYQGKLAIKNFFFGFVNHFFEVFFESLRKVSSHQWDAWAFKEHPRWRFAIRERCPKRRFSFGPSTPFFLFFRINRKRKKDGWVTGKERFRAGYPSGKEDGSYALNDR